MDQLNAAFKDHKSFSRQRKRLQVTVYSDNSCFGRSSEDRPRMSAKSNRAVDERPSLAGPQPLDDLFE